MKLRPNPVKAIISHLVIGLAMAIIFFLLFNDSFWPWTWKHYVVTITPIVLAGGFAYITISQTGYTITPREIIFHKGRHDLFFRFKDIIYVDEDYAKQKKMLRFYLSNGDERFLVLDKQQKLLQITLEKCPHLLTFAQLQARFPKARS